LVKQNLFEGYNLDEYEIKWYCHRCDMFLQVYDDSILSMKSNNFDVVEDDNGDPRIVERIVIEPPKEKTEESKANTNEKNSDLTTVDDVNNAADIDNSNINTTTTQDRKTIAYCNHCIYLQ
jgi:hypothetical protein